MKNLRDCGTIRSEYLRKTKRRMARSMAVLRSIQQADDRDTTDLFRLIREQEEASRLAGFDRMARLCQTMESCLGGLRSGERPGLAAVVPTLLDACRTVELHAEAQAHTRDVEAGQNP